MKALCWVSQGTDLMPYYSLTKTLHPEIEAPTCNVMLYYLSMSVGNISLNGSALSVCPQGKYTEQ